MDSTNCRSCSVRCPLMQQPSVAVDAHRRPKLATLGCGAARQNQPLVSCQRREACESNRSHGAHRGSSFNEWLPHELHREADLEPARNLLALIVADLYMQLLHEVIDIKLVVVMTR